MQQTSEAALRQPAPLRLQRRFAAPRATVFAAWSTAEHVKRWFCPTGYSIPEATVEMRVGGRFEVCMRSPDGVDHWSRGTFVEVAPPDRLVFDAGVADAQGGALFRAYTEVNFIDDAGGTRIEVVQTYTFADPALAAGMVAGAPVGWTQTLDKLAAEIARMQRDGDRPGASLRG